MTKAEVEARLEEVKAVKLHPSMKDTAYELATDAFPRLAKSYKRAMATLTEMVTAAEMEGVNDQRFFEARNEALGLMREYRGEGEKR